MILINDIAKKLNLDEDSLYNYGKYIAKIDVNSEKLDNKNGKLILVTSINPTKYGEGKTTLSIGINDLLNYYGKSSIVVLREPSLGPVFGTKGGATGGGNSKVVPEEEINLHFTSDMHAITSANNLICAVIDNHLYQGNELDIDKDNILFNRCIDMNDRALRDVYLNITDRKEKFNITAASEIMSILCLSNNMEELRNNIDNIIVGYTKDKKLIYVKDLRCTGAVLALLKDAFKPNLVQTLNENPAFIHGGPFANIAHGCSSIVSTKLALKLSDYVIEEAGFGSDMGAFKFFDIKSRKMNINPNLVIINISKRALKYNGEGSLKEGISNLKFHIENMKKFTENILVVLNKFEDDTKEEIDFIKDFCIKNDTDFEISNLYNESLDKSKSLYDKIINICEKDNNINFPYDLCDDLYNKINIVCKDILHAKNILISEETKLKIDNINSSEFKNFPICISKNPVSISGNPKMLGYPKEYDVTISDIEVKSGSGFIIIHIGNVVTLPGLSKESNYLNIDVKDNNIIGVTK